MSNSIKTLKAAERKKLTVQTVIELAAEGNPSEISTTTIAERMGVTQGALFRHFPNKDSILEAVVNWVADKVLSRVDVATKNAESPVEALEAIFMTHIEFISKHPGIPRMLFGELQRSGDTLPKKVIQKFISQYNLNLRVWLVKGMESGDFHSDLDIEAASVLFIGAIQGLVIRALITNDIGSILQNSQSVWNIYKTGLIGDKNA